MNLLKILTTAVAASVIFSCSSPLTTGVKPSGNHDSMAKTITWDLPNGASYVGYGSDSLTGVVTSPDVLSAKSFFSNDTPPVVASNGELEYPQTVQSISYIETSQDLTKTLNWGANLHIGVSGVDIFSASYSSQFSHIISNNSVTFLVYNHTYMGYYQTYNEALTDTALTSLQSDPALFIQHYGDTYVKRAYVGADLGYICTYTFSQDETTNIKSLTTTLKADISNAFGITGGTNLDSTQKSLIAKTSLQITAFTNVANFTPNAIATKDQAQAVWNAEIQRFSSYISANASQLPVLKKIYYTYDNIFSAPPVAYLSYLANAANFYAWKSQWQTLKAKLQAIANSQIISADLVSKTNAAMADADNQVAKLDSKNPTSRAPSATEFSTVLAQWTQEYNTWLASHLDIPLVLVLYRDTSFKGDHILMVQDEANLSLRDFNDTASSAVVYKGPNYAEYKITHNNQEPSVTLYANPNSLGNAAKLTAGSYFNLDYFGVHDNITRIAFNDGSSTTVASPSGSSSDTEYATINTVVEMYIHQDFGGNKQVYVATGNLSASNVDCKTDGAMFVNDEYTSIIIKNGSNGTGTQKVAFGKDKFPNIGTTQTFGVGSVSNLWAFNDMVSSIKFDI